MKILLPMLYFECAAQPLEDILKAFESNDVQRQDQTNLILGHERLSKYSYQFGVKVFAPQKPCNSTTCSKARAKLFMKYVDFNSYEPPDFPIDELLEEESASGNEELRGGPFVRTAQKSPPRHWRAFRMQFWKNLYLGSWDDFKSG